MDVFETKVKPFKEEKDDEEEEEEIQKKQKMLINDFGAYTTLHGFHFLFDSGLRSRRIFWCLLLISGITLLSVQIVRNFNKLHENKSVLNKGVERPKKVKFPAVTICNQNMMLKSKILGTDSQLYLDRMDKFKIYGGTLPSDFMNATFDIETAVRENGHNISTMLLECTMINKPCSYKDFVMRYTSHTRGLCYTINSGDNGQPAAETSTSGLRASLILMLDAQPHEYYGPFSYDATGFKIAIHDQGEFPNMDEDAFDVSPGFFTNIRVRREKETNLPSPYPSQCGTRNLSNSDTYSFSVCLYECFSILLSNKCHCRTLGMAMKGINVTRFCTASEIATCITENYLVTNPAMCDCPKPCESTHYKLRLSSAYFPSDSLWPVLLPMLANISHETGIHINTTGLTAEEGQEKMKEVVRKRVGQVQIFYETLLTDVLLEKPAYDISDFASDIGGNMGLFLGCSILTICEFLDLLVMLCVVKWKRNKAKKCLKSAGFTRQADSMSIAPARGLR